MSNQKITDLTAITGANLADGDEFVVVDVSDTTMAASGTDKRITKAELGAGFSLDSLSNVAGADTAPDTAVLRTNGTTWLGHVLVASDVGADASGAAAAAQAASQPLDSDLTAIAALTTTTYGRSLLTLAAPQGSGALPTIALSSGTAQLFSTTVEVHTPVTFNSLISTISTCKVELSPDNSTFSTLAIWTEPAGTVLAGTIHDVAVRVPAGWYLKLTVAQAVLGTSTYY